MNKYNNVTDHVGSYLGNQTACSAPIEPSTTKMVEDIENWIDNLEKELYTLQDHIYGPSVCENNAKMVEPLTTVDYSIRRSSTRLASLVGTVRTLNNKFIGNSGI